MENINRNAIRDLLTGTPIKKIMTARVFSVHENANLSEAEALFIDQSLTHVPVVDEHNHVVGLLSHMWVYKTQAPRKFVEGDDTTAAADMLIEGDSFYLKETLDRFRLKNIMKSEPFILKETESLAVAIHTMANRRIGCIPIVDDDKILKGIITNQDIISFLAMSLI